MHPESDSFSLMAFRHWHAHFNNQSREGNAASGYHYQHVWWKSLARSKGAALERAQAWKQIVLDMLAIKQLSLTEPQPSHLQNGNTTVSEE